ncbi:MAG: aminopeptidase P N-terminal domain-containing protein [Bacteroidota bacterium]
MKHLPIAPALFIHNRKLLADKLAPRSIAIINSNDILPTSADGTMPFRQNADMFWTTGVDQEETILMLFPDAPEPKLREILFLRETSEKILTWEGYKLSKEQAREATGIETIFWTTEFDAVFRRMMAEADNIYLNTNEHIRADVVVETRDARFLDRCKKQFPLHNYKRLAPIMTQLRMVKSEFEVQQLREACRITGLAFRRLLERMQPGMYEFEAEAEFTYTYIRNRSKGHAYDPIFASGANTCILHYIENSRVCEDGTLILIDAGAEYANYNADMTRVIPVNGKFTPRQRQVYEAVLRVHKAAIKMLVPGTRFADYIRAVAELTNKECIGLGLYTAEDVKKQDPENPLYRKYFMHGVSHHLGLNVHDVSSFYTDMKASMVLTVEPGIYIWEEGIGIRIENNVLITETGQEDLMADIPIEADEIEAIMASARLNGVSSNKAEALA